MTDRIVEVYWFVDVLFRCLLFWRNRFLPKSIYSWICSFKSGFKVEQRCSLSCFVRRYLLITKNRKNENWFRSSVEWSSKAALKSNLKRWSYKVSCRDHLKDHPKDYLKDYLKEMGMICTVFQIWKSSLKINSNRLHTGRLRTIWNKIFGCWFMLVLTFVCLY